MVQAVWEGTIEYLKNPRVNNGRCGIMYNNRFGRFYDIFEGRDAESFFQEITRQLGSAADKLIKTEFKGVPIKIIIG